MNVVANLRSVKEVLDFSEALSDEPSKPSSISVRRTLEGRHMEEDDIVSLDDVGHTIAILSHLHTYTQQVREHYIYFS